MSHSDGRISSNNNSTSSWQKETDDTTHECVDVNSTVKNKEKEGNKKNKWSKSQWIILATSSLGNFGNGLCYSLQAPFFPAEADKKGVTPTVYGFIFSMFSLTMFFSAPVFGKYIEVIGPRFMMNTGIFITSNCCILFGVLDKIHSRTSFTTLAFLIRIVEALGNAAYQTANFSTTAATFPKDMGKIFAFLTATFGLGLILGPPIGGVLHHVGGYTLPFAVVGSILLSVSIFSTILFWNEPGTADSKNSESSLVKALRIPSVSLSMTGVCSATLSVGFLVTTLEPHLRQFKINAIQVGLVFVISGATVAVTTVFWGWLSDRKVPPKLLLATGAFFISVSYVLIGPPPFIPFDSSLVLIIIGLILHGFGLAAEILASQIDALRQSILNGFPESYQTYGVISGAWSAFFHLGNFIGSSIGGVMLDQIGFREATIVLLCLHLILMTANFLYYFVLEHRATPISDNENSLLLS